MSLSSDYPKSKRLWRNEYMLVDNPLFSHRLFQACQRIKHKLYTGQSVRLCAWKLKQDGAVVDEQAECSVDVTALLMNTDTALTKQQYVDIVNQHFNLNVVLGGGTDMSFTFELRYRYRSKQ